MSDKPVIPHTLKDQLTQMQAIHDVEQALLKRRQNEDQQDILTAFAADATWSGQHKRLLKARDEG